MASHRLTRRQQRWPPAPRRLLLQQQRPAAPRRPPRPLARRRRRPPRRRRGRQPDAASPVQPAQRDACAVGSARRGAPARAARAAQQGGWRKASGGFEAQERAPAWDTLQRASAAAKHAQPHAARAGRDAEVAVPRNSGLEEAAVQQAVQQTVPWFFLSALFLARRAHSIVHRRRLVTRRKHCGWRVR
jgi:hypothetical protein